MSLPTGFWSRREQTKPAADSLLLNLLLLVMSCAKIVDDKTNKTNAK